MFIVNVINSATREKLCRNNFHLEIEFFKNNYKETSSNSDSIFQSRKTEIVLSCETYIHVFYNDVMIQIPFTD